MKFFDTHCHLAGDELLPHAEELLARALEKNVRGLAIIAADEVSLSAIPGLIERLKARAPEATIVGSSGIHPHEAIQVSDALWNQIVSQAEQAVAIGETGLDYFYDHSDRASQRELFARHIALACDLKKPLVIHCRNASADVLELLDTPELKRHPNPGILHCFTEDMATAKRLLDLNFYISFSGIVSFRNAENLREVARQVPLERLLIETDSPWLAPIPHRGKRNEPAFVVHTFEVVRELRGIEPEGFARSLWENSCRVFGLGVS